MRVSESVSKRVTRTGGAGGRPTCRRWLRVVLSLLLLGIGLVLSPLVLRWWVDRRYKKLIYTVEAVPTRAVALVFGAGLTLAQGVPDEDIVLHYAGRRTYDTCYRAGYIFGVKDAILVTQWFHLDRALYTCDKLGISAVGVAAGQCVLRIRPRL